MKRILVTGGAGFIGSHTVEALLAAGWDVCVLDNLSSGRREHIPSNVYFIEMDLLSTELAQVLLDYRPDLVIHMAAQINVAASISDPIKDCAVNVQGTAALLDACRLAGVRKVVFSSSAAVYGIPHSSPVGENDPKQPQSFYGLSKLTAEAYFAQFFSHYGIDYTVLRYSNVFGPRQTAGGEGGVISIFMKTLAGGDMPVIYGDGDQTRDFVHVRDIVSANIAALQYGSGRIMNVSSNTSISVNELLRMMCDITGQPFGPLYAPTRQGDIRHSRLDNSEAMRWLHWQPSTTLEEGLREMWAGR